jgi:hypothetical protein
VAIGDVGVAARIEKEASTANLLKTFLSRHFYLCMSLLLAALAIAGFSRTVNTSLFHANPPRPLLLWIHAAVFSTWIVFFIAQSALVRARKVNIHRSLGWFGAGLAAVMVVMGFRVAVVMTRFDTVVLQQQGIDSFLSIPFGDMIIFGSCMAMAIQAEPLFQEAQILQSSVPTRLRRFARPTQEHCGRWRNRRAR